MTKPKLFTLSVLLITLTGCVRECVIIGDSIAEGHPYYHGRLHSESGKFDHTINNQDGQPSHELTNLTKCEWINHGIGRQTSVDVLRRWNRDALGKTDPISDGRPAKTLDKRPKIIWVNVGINDVAQMIDTETTKANLMEMAKSAKKNNIKIGFNTIGPDNGFNEKKREMQADINHFIVTDIKKTGALIFDYHSWFADPSNKAKANPQLSFDGVHPSKTGYIELSTKIAEELK